jgi:hypothetical protein
MARAPRNYRKEYDEFQGKPEQIKRRAQRNSARASAAKRGAVKKGDGKEIDHLGFNRKGALDNKKTRVVSKKVNRSRQPKRNGKHD